MNEPTRSGPAEEAGETKGQSAGGATHRFHVLAALLLISILTVLSVWSSGDAVSLLTIEMVGALCRFSIDDRIITEKRIPARERGGVGYYLYRTFVPSVPRPQVLQRVIVHDFHTGEVLFDEDYRTTNVDEASWTERKGAWRIEQGGLTTWPEEGALLAVRDWGDVRLTMTIANLLRAQIFFRVHSAHTFSGVFLRPFRDFDSRLFVTDHFAKVHETDNATSLLSPSMTAKRTLNVLLHGFPMLAPLVVAAIVVPVLMGLLLVGLSFMPALLRLVLRISATASRFARHSLPAFLVAIALCVSAGFWFRHVTETYLENVPHVQDSAVMLFQARTLAAGKLAVAAPPQPEHFRIDFVNVKNGLMFGQYLPGYPLFLALGVIIGRPWLIPAFASSVLLLTVFFLGKRLLGPWWGVLAAGLLFASPFFQMTAPNFMSHTVASLYLALTVLLFLGLERGQSNFFRPVAGGLMLGLLLNTRPMTAAAAAFTLIIMSLFSLIGSDNRKRLLMRLVLFGLATSLMLGCFLLYNNYLMGDPFSSTYGSTAQRVTGPAFDETRLAKAVLDNFTLVTLFMMVLTGWPAVITSLSLFAFSLPDGKSKRGPLLCVLLIFSVFAAYMFYSISSVTVMYGPRYVSEVMFPAFLLMLFGMRSLVTCGERISFALLKPLRNRVTRYAPFEGHPGISPLVRGVMLLPLVIVVIHLSWASFGNWRSEHSRPWPGNAYIPQNVSELRSFNHISPRIQKLVADANISNAIVFVSADAGRQGQWWHFGSVFFENSPTFDGDIVYARDIGEESNAALLKHFPGRAVWRAHYERGTLERLSDAASLPSATDDRATGTDRAGHND